MRTIVPLVRVRIAVMVTASGEWVASGEDGVSDDRLRSEVLDCASGRSHVVWVEADVPLPVEPTVVGAVELPDGPDADELLERGHEDGYRRGYAEGLRHGRAEERTTDAPIPF